MKVGIWQLILIVALLVVAGLARWWWTGGLDRVQASMTAGQAKANALVAAYAKHVGARDAVHQSLDEHNDRSFGDFGFHYFPDRDVLQGRVFYGKSHIKEWPDRAHFERQVIAGLNDPKIGGMYDRGGGYFVLDEDKQMYFLMKDYPMATTDVMAFIKDFDNLNDLMGIWVTSWGPHAARQSYGAEPLPTQHIDREHNPYGKH
ncbi:MAG TPA: hypothetical protein VGC07_02045 [Granulicella sp.]